MEVAFSTFRPMHEEVREELEEAMRRVMEESWYIRGKECTELEREFARYCGCRFAVGVGNGLDALYLILRALGIGEGDEVILPSNTFIATALAVSYAGATPVLAEPDRKTYNLNPENLERAITGRTRAVIPVHLYGRPADMEPILEIAENHGLLSSRMRPRPMEPGTGAEKPVPLASRQDSVFTREKIWEPWETAGA